MKNLILVFFLAVIGGTLGYAIGNSLAVQSCETCQIKPICQCGEDCKCCASCSCSHGE